MLALPLLIPGGMNRVPRRRSLPEVRLGYLPLLDAAPLLVARELGLFSKWGVAVHLRQELGWASIREKLIYGELEGAHAPALMAFSLHLGLQTRSCPVRSALLLSRQGNAITISRRLWLMGARDLASLRQLIRAEQPRRMTFAVVSLFSSHHFLLRRWLVQAGLDPDTAVRIVVLPPSLMGEHMREGSIDGFCVGEPWNSAAALAGEGWIAADSTAIDPRHPEKVLLCREGFVASQPEELAAIQSAITEACAWCDQPARRTELARMLAQSGIYGLPAPVLGNALNGSMDWGAGRKRSAEGFIRFHDGSPMVVNDSDCRQLLAQARGLGLPSVPAAMNLPLARRLFLPAASRLQPQPEIEKSAA